MSINDGAHDPSARYAGTCALLAASGQNANFAGSAKGRNTKSGESVPSLWNGRLRPILRDGRCAASSG
jgi:hypothetical protein